MKRTKVADLDATAAVENFLATLDHPRKDTIIALRRILLDIDPAISEEIKWNAPSFRTTEHFATMNLREKDGVMLILHFGAKKRPPPDEPIEDASGLLKWLGPDRASVMFRDTDDLAARRDALVAVVQQWMRHV